MNNQEMITLIEKEIPFPAEPYIKNYFSRMQSQAALVYKHAIKAKSTKIDVSDVVEVVPAVDLADRAETIIGLKGLANVFRELFEQHKDRRKAYFQLFKEIIEQKWWNIPDDSKRIETAIKACLLIETEGVVVAPLDGVPKVEINKNPDGSKYVDVYFAGPIRAAGGSSTVIPLLLADYGRTLLGLDKYKPTQDELERYVEEIGIYQTEIISRQYTMKDEEIRIIIRGCPICINGVPTEEVEVSAHRDIARIPTNRIRGGMGLVVAEGLALKALWVMKTAKEHNLNWDFLEKIVKVEKTQTKIEIKPNKSFLDRLAAGRPILAYPSTWGGFRLRYGRGRNTGIMAKAINPATMILTDEFIAVGTHGRMERPGKATQFFPCSTIDGPVVLLKDGSVERINTVQRAEEVKAQIDKIIYLGDLLASYGDFKKSAHPLIPAGYCEEWWVLELKKALEDNEKRKKFSELNLEKLIKNPREITEKEALAISWTIGVPLHPKYLHFYRALNCKEAKYVKEKLSGAEIKKSGDEIIELIIEKDAELKLLLEKIGLPHSLKGGKIIITDFASTITSTFDLTNSLKNFIGKETVKQEIEGQKNEKQDEGRDGKQNEKQDENQDEKQDVLDYLSKISGLTIRDKAGSFVGGRMGRPEQAKPRKMIGNPHVLFPIGLKGGSTRSIIKAIDEYNNETGKITTEIAEYFCKICSRKSFSAFCVECGERTKRMSYCPQCNKSVMAETCPSCGNKTVKSGEHEVDLRSIVLLAKERIKEPLPDLIKGVKGMISDEKEIEPIEKGIFRAKHDVHIFKDGTSRFELLNAVITHFTPKEIGLTVEKVKELGYTKDIFGKEINDNNQIIELFPQDIVVNETCGDWLLQVSKFIDDLLEKFYKVERFYNAKTKEDLIGHLVLGLAPHTSAAVNSRVLGYTKARLGFGHPYFVCAKRRNCLAGDEMVLLQKKGKTEYISIESLCKGENETVLEDMKAFAIKRNGEIILRDAPILIRKKTNKGMYSLKTASGRKITITPDHKMLVLEGKEIKEKEATKLCQGDVLVALNKKIDFQQNKEINIINYYLSLKEEKKKKIRVHNSNLKQRIMAEGYSKLSKSINYHSSKSIHTAFNFDSVPLDLYEKIITHYKLEPEKNTYLSYAKQKHKIPSFLPLSREIGELVGLFLSDGCARTNDDGKRKKYVYQTVFLSAEKQIDSKIKNVVFKTFGAKLSISKRKKLKYFTLSGRVYYDFFEKILVLGENARDKKISPEIINSNFEFIKGLVGGYIVGDGYIDTNSIKISTVNKNLTNGIALLLNQLGAFPHFGEEDREIKTGLVKDYYLKKGKTIHVKSYIIRLYSEDLINIGKELFGEKKKKYELLIKQINFRGKRTKKIGDFVVDKIKEIKIAPPIERYVYDLIVEGEKNFVGGFGALGVYDCDGDQDSIMLMMDGLLNFSNKFLSHKSGGKMDAPLVATIIINPSEVDDEVHKMETCWEYPLEMYEKAQNVCEPDIKGIELVKDILGKERQYSQIGYTHETTFFDEGPKMSRYIQLKTMEEKIQKQNTLQKKIMAVDAKDALERVMASHFLPDIIGNARAFSRQTFRCTACNEIYRRIPLSGKCYKCGKNSLILTIHEGSVRKYLKIAQNMARQENLSPYLIQRLDMVEKEIDSVFKNDKEEQKGLFDFV